MVNVLPNLCEHLRDFCVKRSLDYKASAPLPALHERLSDPTKAILWQKSGEVELFVLASNTVVQKGLVGSLQATYFAPFDGERDSNAVDVQGTLLYPMAKKLESVGLYVPHNMYPAVQCKDKISFSAGPLAFWVRTEDAMGHELGYLLKTLSIEE